MSIGTILLIILILALVGIIPVWPHPLKVTTEKSRTLPLPPIVGAVALVGGIALLLTGRKND